ncbi:small subunit ribosomal protein S20 [Natronobacillus azotifigens]|uniref:Small ribosomal subunit protein bS20 n=1 Tax=Natronobacillus azotifigens TaxID=472978 RepID=A0A9J6REY9_9BACI|nr:30S ribosomal protein S20 [Natronobacillus azotifigens]MCZ0704005.1 30S ribosomal protein S20 [Natronobacillus azotifigens]
MANIKSAIKRVRLNQDRHALNAPVKSEMRTNIKRVESLISENNAAEAKVALTQAIKKIDKAIQKGIIHQNSGDRQKSRLTKQVNQLSA